jgi:hypothetical protein
MSGPILTSAFVLVAVVTGAYSEGNDRSSTPSLGTKEPRMTNNHATRASSSPADVKSISLLVSLSRTSVEVFTAARVYDGYDGYDGRLRLGCAEKGSKNVVRPLLDLAEIVDIRARGKQPFRK